MQEKSERAGDQAGSLASGTQLGPYRVDAYIGAGGMGEVFRATDTRLRRCVAVKLLPLKRAVDPLSQQRFLQEARAASALNHPNIVSIHDISTHQGRDFIVMEFVEGQTLRNLIGKDGMPVPQITNLGVQIASALNAAHSAGIVHRDIKPDNIMVTSGQVVKILDFGIAKTIWRTAPASDETGTLTDFQAEAGIVGTVAYMSPEQARGETVDGRSDIFSLGSLLYEAATGKLPFTGKNVLSVMHEIGTVTPAAPSKLRPEIPSAFDHLITRCLEKDPARRPSRASEIAEALQSFAVPSRITSIEPTTSRRVVAVVPFQFHGASQEDRFLSVALAESVANRLGSSASLVVRPTSSLVKYSGQIIDGAQIARETNVDIVVEGSIQKLGTRIRVLVQVLEHRDLQTLYSGKLDGDMADLFAVQDRLADSVYDALTPHAPRKPVRTEPPHARHPLAFELYMRATEKTVCFAKFEVGAIIEMLEKAVELDPNFADAWGMLSTTCWQMGAHIDPDPKWFSRAEQAISRTLELDPINCDAFCARGMIHFSASRGFQLAPALRALNASLKINPGRALARAQRGGILFHIGFHEAALENFDECIFANPDMALGYAARSQTEIFMGNYAKAEDLMQRALALEPTLVQAHISVPLPMICQGNLGKAWEKLRKSKQMIPEEPQIASLEGLILACEGNFSRAEQLADQAVASARSMVHSHHTWHVAAGVYAVCGKPEKAIAELKRCSQNGLPNYRAFEADPHLRSLHSHPDFVALMRDLRRGYESLREEFDVSEVYVPRHTTSPR